MGDFGLSTTPGTQPKLKVCARPGIGRHRHRCVQRGEFAHLKALAEEKKRKQRRQIGPECDADAKSRLPVQVAGSICVVYRAMPAKFPKPISSQTLSLDAVRVTSFSPEVEGWLKRWASRQRRYLGPRPYSRAAR